MKNISRGSVCTGANNWVPIFADLVEVRLATAGAVVGLQKRQSRVLARLQDGFLVPAAAVW
jgi:hypothetical protein